MAIQFPCVSCGKSIEIDEQWALRLVECPYCHDTVRAPGMSTLAEDPPVAAQADAPATPFSHVAPPPPAPPPGAAVPAGSSGVLLAIVSLVLSGLAFALFLWAAITVTVAVGDQLGEDTTPAEMQQFMEDAMQNGEPWVNRMVLIGLACFGAWLAALVVGIVAATRAQGRGVAFFALAVVFLPMMLFVVALVLQA